MPESSLSSDRPGDDAAAAASAHRPPALSLTEATALSGVTAPQSPTRQLSDSERLFEELRAELLREISSLRGEVSALRASNNVKDDQLRRKDVQVAQLRESIPPPVTKELHQIWRQVSKLCEQHTPKYALPLLTAESSPIELTRAIDSALDRLLHQLLISPTREGLPASAPQTHPQPARASPTREGTAQTKQLQQGLEAAQAAARAATARAESFERTSTQLAQRLAAAERAQPRIQWRQLLALGARRLSEELPKLALADERLDNRVAQLIEQDPSGLMLATAYATITASLDRAADEGRCRQLEGTKQALCALVQRHINSTGRSEFLLKLSGDFAKDVTDLLSAEQRRDLISKILVDDRYSYLLSSPRLRETVQELAPDLRAVIANRVTGTTQKLVLLFDYQAVIDGTARAAALFGTKPFAEQFFLVQQSTDPVLVAAREMLSYTSLIPEPKIATFWEMLEREPALCMGTIGRRLSALALFLPEERLPPSLAALVGQYRDTL